MNTVKKLPELVLIMRFILIMLFFFISLANAGDDLIFKSQFENPVGITRVALSKDVAGVTHVGWLTTRSGNLWNRNDEINLSVNSSGSNAGPVFAKDFSKVIWTSYTNPGMDFDENTITGNNFQQILTHSRLGTSAQIIRPSYESEGTIVFEGESGGEQCYRYNPATPEIDPIVIDGDYNNDNSCSSLPDGRIASFWLERPGGPSVHELRIMSKSGIHESVLQLNIDFLDYLITAGTYY